MLIRHQTGLACLRICPATIEYPRTLAQPATPLLLVVGALHLCLALEDFMDEKAPAENEERGAKG